MAHYINILSFLLLSIVFVSHLKIEARESKFFNKATKDNATTTTLVEPPAAAPSETENESYGYGLYGHSRDEFRNNKVTSSASTGDTLFESKFPSEEFSEQSNKEEFYKNGLPSNYNEHSYVTVPQGDNFNGQKFIPTTGNYDDEFANEQKFTPITANYNNEFVNGQKFTSNNDEFENEQKFTPETSNYNDEFTNNEVETPEEKDLFKNGYHVKEQNQNAYVNVNEPQELSEAPKFVEKDDAFNYNNVNNGYESNNHNNVNEAQGLSDTRTLENGKYRYALDGEGRQIGTVKPGPGVYNNEGYYGNGERKSKYEFDTMEEFERQEGYPQGEYLP